MFLIPSSIQDGASLPKTRATLTTFTERKVAYEMEWKLAIQRGRGMFRFTPAGLILISAYCLLLILLC